jgi:hypothetical protein
MRLRKYVSIVFLLILLFNMAGYRAWFYYAEKKADLAMEDRLDKNQYNEKELVALTIPLYNPYQLEQKTFERIDGEISFGGKTYKYVKRKIADGNLVLLCIPAAHKMMMKEGKTSYGNAVNDMTGNGKSPSKSSLKNVNAGDYEDHQYHFEFFNFSNAARLQNTFQVASDTEPHIASPGKPPQYRA